MTVRTILATAFTTIAILTAASATASAGQAEFYLDANGNPYVDADISGRGTVVTDRVTGNGTQRLTVDARRAHLRVTQVGNGELNVEDYADDSDKHVFCGSGATGRPIIFEQGDLRTVEICSLR